MSPTRTTSRRPAVGPLSLLAAALLPVAGAYGITSAGQGGAALAVFCVAAPLVVRRWASTLRRLAVGLLAAGSLGLSTWLYGGRELDPALAAMFRVLYLLVPAAVLTPFIDAGALGDHLAQRLRLPARAVVAATVALERIEALGQQWRQIARARRARGVGADGHLLNRARVNVSMAVALLVSAMRMSGAMALAMDARGFATASRRTWAEPAPWRWGDTLVLLAGLAMAALPWVLRSTIAGPFFGVR